MKQKINFLPNINLADQCYDQIQEDIIEGTLRPGQKLKVEPLKEKFGVGQSPIREALSRLVASGMVESEDNKGFKVTQISEKDIRDTYDMYTQIELLALKLAIERGDIEWEASILAALHKLAMVENKNEAMSYNIWSEVNYNFHVALISGCKSPILLDIRKNLYIKFDRYCRTSFNLAKDKLSLNHEEHRKMAEAIISRDIKKAEELMVRHINEPLEDIINIFKANKLF